MSQNEQSIERQVAEHYAVGSLADSILTALREIGEDPEQFEAEAAAPVDEFHIGGRPATMHFADLLNFSRGHRVLDMGCGLGGAARFMAQHFACHVEGVDLTPEYVEVARLLSARTDQEDRTSFEVGNACALPHADAHFDGAFTIHVAMNIHNREGLYREAARVLKPGATFGIYDIMAGPKGDLTYPVPWAEDVATSHLTTSNEMHVLLRQAGFEIVDFQDRTAFAKEFLRTMKARMAEHGAPPLGLHLLTGDNSAQKFSNMATGLAEGHVIAGVMIARKI